MLPLTCRSIAAAPSFTVNVVAAVIMMLFAVMVAVVAATLVVTAPARMSLPFGPSVPSSVMLPPVIVIVAAGFRSSVLPPAAVFESAPPAPVAPMVRFAKLAEWPARSRMPFGLTVTGTLFLTWLSSPYRTTAPHDRARIGHGQRAAGDGGVAVDHPIDVVRLVEDERALLDDDRAGEAVR